MPHDDSAKVQIGHQDQGSFRCDKRRMPGRMGKDILPLIQDPDPKIAECLALRSGHKNGAASMSSYKRLDRTLGRALLDIQSSQ